MGFLLWTCLRVFRLPANIHPKALLRNRALASTEILSD
jgi:hypothetical protein